MAVSVVSFTPQSPDYFTTGGTRTITGLSWSAGDVIVVGATSENASSASPPHFDLPTNANLTFSQRAGIPAGSQGSECPIYLWTAVAGSSQTGQTISVVNDNAGNQNGLAVWILSGASGSFANISANMTESGFTFTPTAGSGVIYMFGDWNANTTNQTIATGTGTATERVDVGNGSNYGVYCGDWMDVSASSTTFGVTSYTGLQVAHAVIEVLASGAAPASRAFTKKELLEMGALLQL